MSKPVELRAPGLAGLLAALQPPPPLPAEVPPDLGAIRAEAWDAGFAAGAASAEAGLAPVRLHLAAAAAAFDAACMIDGDALRPLLVSLVGDVAGAVVMGELAVDPALLARLVDAALALVRPNEAATLCAHPATLALLRPRLGDLATTADPAMAKDAFRITGDEFGIEAGLAARLAAIMEEVA